MKFFKNRVVAWVLALAMIGGGVGLSQVRLANQPPAEQSTVSVTDVVDDQAGVLSDRTVQQILQQNRELQQENGSSIHVSTIQSFEGSLLEAAQQIFDEKQLDDRAFLLVLAPNQHGYQVCYGDDLKDILGSGASSYDYIYTLTEIYLEDDIAAGAFNEATASMTEEMYRLMESSLAMPLSPAEEAATGAATVAVLLLAGSGVAYLIRRRPKAKKVDTAPNSSAMPGAYRSGPRPQTKTGYRPPPHTGMNRTNRNTRPNPPRPNVNYTHPNARPGASSARPSGGAYQTRPPQSRPSGGSAARKK